MKVEPTNKETRYTYSGTLEEKIARFKERNQDWERIPHDTIAFVIRENFVEVKHYFLEIFFKMWENESKDKDEMNEKFVAVLNGKIIETSVSLEELYKLVQEKYPTEQYIHISFECGGSK